MLFVALASAAHVSVFAESKAAPLRHFSKLLAGLLVLACGVGDENGEHPHDSEGLARYACLWLLERGWLWGIDRAMRDGQPRDRVGRRAFQAVTGQRVADVDEAWRGWVLAGAP